MFSSFKLLTTLGGNFATWRKHDVGGQRTKFWRKIRDFKIAPKISLQPALKSPTQNKLKKFLKTQPASFICQNCILNPILQPAWWAAQLSKFLDSWRKRNASERKFFSQFFVCRVCSINKDYLFCPSLKSSSFFGTHRSSEIIARFWRRLAAIPRCFPSICSCFSAKEFASINL